MTLTLLGRLQTRLLVGLGVELPCLVVLGLVAGWGAGRAVLAGIVVGTLSLAWEPAWHGLQQLRWDRDWPSAFALLAGAPEAVLAKLALAVLGVLPAGHDGAAFLLVFAGSWALGWLAQQGPLRVLFPAARFEGGRVLARRTPAPAHGLAQLREPVAAGSAAASAAASAARGSSRRPPTPAARPPRRIGGTGRRRGVVVVGAVTALAFVLFSVLDLGPHHGGAPVSQGSPAPVPATPAASQRTAQPWTVPAGQAVVSSWDTRRAVTPYAVTVPRLGLQSLVEPVALAHGSIAGPTKSADVGWYSASAAPGHTGPAVLIGTTRPGPFARIARLVGGDTVLVTRSDATTVQYVVTRVEKVRAASFPSAEVYASTPQPTLRLIGFGSPGRTGGGYTLVFATAVHLLHPEGTP